MMTDEKPSEEWRWFFVFSPGNVLPFRNIVPLVECWGYTEMVDKIQAAGLGGDIFADGVIHETRGDAFDERKRKEAAVRGVMASKGIQTFDSSVSSEAVGFLRKAHTVDYLMYACWLVERCPRINLSYVLRDLILEGQP